MSPNLYGRMDGLKFWRFPWFPGNFLLFVIKRYTVYVYSALWCPLFPGISYFLSITISLRPNEFPWFWKYHKYEFFFIALHPFDLVLFFNYFFVFRPKKLNKPGTCSKKHVTFLMMIRWKSAKVWKGFSCKIVHYFDVKSRQKGQKRHQMLSKKPGTCSKKHLTFPTMIHWKSAET